MADYISANTATWYQSLLILEYIDDYFLSQIGLGRTYPF